MQEEKYTANGVIARGYEIYDTWNDQKYKSRKIVDAVRTAVAFACEKKTKSTRLEAIAHLFALELRTKERYKSILKCLLLYFSWRRETGALKRLKGALRLAEGRDLRDLIALEIAAFREGIDEGKADGTDHNAHGGKASEFSADEKAASARAQSLEGGQNTSKEALDAMERAAEERALQEQLKEQTREHKEPQAADQREHAQQPQEKSERLALDSKTALTQNSTDKLKVENNGSTERSEPATDKKSEAQSNWSALDLPPIYEEKTGGKDTDKISFIDEMILDNMIKHKDVIGYNPFGDAKPDTADTPSQENGAPRVEKSEGRSKDAFLYDKLMENIGNDARENAVDPTQEAAQPKSDVKPEEERTQIRVEDGLDAKNAFRRAMDDKYTVQMIHFHKSLMENALREELKIASEAFGIKEPVRIIGESKNVNTGRVVK